MDIILLIFSILYINTDFISFIASFGKKKRYKVKQNHKGNIYSSIGYNPYSYSKF